MPTRSRPARRPFSPPPSPSWRRRTRTASARGGAPWRTRRWSVVTGGGRTGRAGCKITVVALQSSASAAVATAASAAVAWVSPPAASDAASAPSQPPPPPLLTLTAVNGGDGDARRVVLMAFGPPAGGRPRLCARRRRCTWTWCRPRLSCCRRGKRRRRCWSYTLCRVLRRRLAAARRSTPSRSGRPWRPCRWVPGDLRRIPQQVPRPVKGGHQD